MSRGREKRVGELVRQEIANLLTSGLKDPRIGFVSVMHVRMSPDLRYANVYVSLLGDAKECTGSLVALRSSAGWLRGEVGRRLRMRYAPEIRFFEDTSLDDAFRLEEIFREIHSEGEGAEDAGG
ncbi:MAG TPA: 30S ribosome-binding factor RbfA [Candidatus Hydrogenedentes bacterium]|nr:30S ribosome-binding factor RbfA [Candidatus Hydrogenedentota bacterium]HQE83061.1 30S ribosome-binding factor RbfA [Candidatus Hydrogenedentota bacterium]HQH53337.1 30S ribosome-binding factor RbfA [Candidatus Hydrogenedentota bacterium]HQM49131.1 30S ribosome-binding factor RbfA [Candidatus Hydrogenedentota bacterium]